MKGSNKALSIAISLLLIPYATAQQQNIQIQDLKDLKLLTQKVSSVSEYPGRPSLAQVQEVPGRAYAVRSPLSAQQLEFLHPSGTKLAAGQDFIALSGPEVHHYFSQYEIKKTLFELAAKQYQRNKPLFAQSAISQQLWLEINQAYFAAKLDYDEMQHFFELVARFDEESETLTLKSPIAGALYFDNGLRSVIEGTMIARIIPNDAIRVSVNIDNTSAAKIAYLSTPINTCVLQIGGVEAVASGLTTKIWSTPLDPACAFVLGQRFSVTPYLHQQAYSIPRQAVFSMQGEQFVLVKSNQQLDVVQVSLTSSIHNNYVVTSATNLTNQEVLISSVSAVQGILLGLGGE